ncbi:ABC transporter permease [Filifactor alocis]
MRKNSFFWKMVRSSISRRKSRMFTALLAIAMGATILSGLVTIYYDIPRQLGKEFRSYGANLIVIPGDASSKIEEKQVQEIRSAIGAQKLVGLAPYIYQNAKINEQPYIVAGTDMEGLKNNSPFWLVSGEWPAKPREVMLGAEIAKNLELDVGTKFTLNIPKKGGESGETTATDFVVVSTVITGGKEEELIFMSSSDLRAIIGDVPYDVVECSVEAEATELENIANKIGENDSTLIPQLVKRVTESQDIVLEKLQALVWIVTVIVLFIMMICVSTTMMAVVTERRKEIGLKKALGAGNKSVVMDFLGEGIVLGAGGGALGVVLGYLFASQVSVSVFARKVNFLIPLVPITIIVAVIITVVACLIPVRTAVDVEPALVLRGE